MMLSDAEILYAYRKGKLSIEPFDANLIQPCSIDVLLGGSFRTFWFPDDHVIRPGEDQLQHTKHYEFETGDVFQIAPQEFMLATTLEVVGVGEELACSLLGKSSLGRLGLVVHATAGHVDPGFQGQITLELFNMSSAPIELTVGMRIGQLAFTKLSSPAVTPYGSPVLGSRYQGQMGATVSRSHIK